jgi:hypothetical protein
VVDLLAHGGSTSEADDLCQEAIARATVDARSVMSMRRDGRSVLALRRSGPRWDRCSPRRRTRSNRRAGHAIRKQRAVYLVLDPLPDPAFEQRK